MGLWTAARERVLLPQADIAAPGLREGLAAAGRRRDLRRCLPHRGFPGPAGTAAWQRNCRAAVGGSTPRGTAGAEPARRPGGSSTPGPSTPSWPPRPVPHAALPRPCSRWAGAGSSPLGVRRRQKLPCWASRWPPPPKYPPRTALWPPWAPYSPTKGTPDELSEPPPAPPPHHPGHAPADRREPSGPGGPDPARVHPRRPQRTGTHHVHAGRGAAHHRVPRARRGRGRGTGRRRHHAVRRSRRARCPRHRLPGPRRRPQQGHPRRPRRGGR